MKIQINSKEAFDRLVNGDPEMEIHIKNAIIQDFAKTYLKSVANSEVTMNLQLAVLQEVKEELAKNYITRSTKYAREYIDAKDELKEKIRDEVSNTLNDIIVEEVKKQMKDVQSLVNRRMLYSKEYIEDKMTKGGLDAIIHQHVQTVIREQLSKLGN